MTDPTTAAISYRAMPYVCGALGRWDRDAMACLRSASPDGLREIHTDETTTLWSTSGLERWRTGGRRGYLWWPLASGPRPASWRDASERRLAAGLVVGRNEATLHSDALGFQELYVRRHRDALYFSVRIDPLLVIDDGPLHCDWAAWAGALTITGPVGDATPFLEVRRVEAATAWVAGDDGLMPARFQPSWLATEPDPGVSPADVLDAISPHVPGRFRRSVVPLSGGWDSRLLAGIARRSGGRVDAWTISKDLDHDFDLELAGPVAAALGLTHRVVRGTPEAWADDCAELRRRSQFQSWMHAWIVPLARELRERKEPVLDGIGGDVLLRTSLSEEILDAPPETTRAKIWERLSGGRVSGGRWFTPGAAESLKEMSFAAYSRAVARFDHHHVAIALGTLHTYVGRGIAQSPLWLFAPECDVRFPFIHPDVMSVVLRIPAKAKRKGAFYRDMMRLLRPDLAALPSTNDSEIQASRTPQRQTSEPALRALTELISADTELCAMFSSSLAAALTDPPVLRRCAGYTVGRGVLQWAALMADWRGRYGHRLASTACPS